MKGEVVQFVFIVLAIVVSASAEELLPAFFGMGLPLLLALVVVLSSRLDVLPAVMTAVGAGTFENALVSSSPMVSVCFFVIAALLSRKEYFPRPFLLLLFPAFVLWKGVCAAGGEGVFVRAALSLPLGAAAWGVQHIALNWLRGKAGLDE